jgi:hypothetical protein
MYERRYQCGHQRKGVMGWDLSNGRDSTLRQMNRVIVQKSDESTKLLERLSAKSGKDWSTTQRAKAWLCHAGRGCSRVVRTRQREKLLSDGLPI